MEQQGELSHCGDNSRGSTTERTRFNFRWTHAIFWRLVREASSAVSSAEVKMRTQRHLLSVIHFHKYLNSLTASVVYWSEFLATDPEARVRFSAL
jgi:hypothetical protein